MKLCKDCKWCYPDHSFDSIAVWPWQKRKLTDESWRFAECAHPKAISARIKYFPVNGIPDKPETACAVIRHDAEYNKNRCGVSAQWFEPKEPK